MSAADLIRVRSLAASGTARALREATGLSLTEVAREAGVHKATVYRWERGLRRPRGEAAIRYLRVLDELARR